MTTIFAVSKIVIHRRIMIDQQKIETIVLWVIWFAFMTEVVMFQFILGNGIPTGEDNGKASTVIVAVGIVAFVISKVIRWVLIPKAKTIVDALRFMTIGLWCSSFINFMGIFLIEDEFPNTQLLFFVLALIGSVQFAPIYAPKSKPELPPTPRL